MSKTIAIAAAVTVGLGAAVSAADADFMLVEDWEGYATGQGDQFAADNITDAAAGQWYENTGNDNGSIVDDPDGIEGQVLKMAAGAANNGYGLNLGAAALLDGQTSTLFFRINANGAQIQARLSDNVSTPQWNWFSHDRTSLAINSEPKITGGGNQSAIEAGEWYNVWLVVDLAADNYDVYYSEGTQSPTSHATDFALLDQTLAATSPDNLDIFMLTLGEDSSVNGVSYIGDIWVDTAGQNLGNPIPEPGTFVFMGLGGLLMIRRRTAS